MYKIGLSIPDDAKEKLEVICKKEQRNKNNMMAFLIDFYYQKIQKREKERKSNDEDYDLYEEALKLKGKIHSWSGDLEEMSENRIDYDNN